MQSRPSSRIRLEKSQSASAKRQLIEDSSIPEPNSGCWLWEFSLDSRGYGKCHWGKIKRAHRVSYAAFYGDPGELCVLHKCDNPCCVNPEHLFLGTQGDNMRDKTAKGRNNAPRGVSCSWARLTDDDVREIKKALAAGETGRSLAKRFGVTFGQISNIKVGKAWRHV